MPSISVIVPAYNAGRFIAECLSSLVVQTYSDFEVIVCDDGSTDDTIEIVNSIANKDDRFRCCTLEHVGAGNARNMGMSQAAGEYLYFLDADDMVAPEALEKFYAAATRLDADIVIAKSHYLDDVTKEISPIDFSIQDVPSGVALKGRSLPKKPFQSFVGWPWDKFFRSDFIRAHRLQFQNLRSSNDALFVFMALCHAECICCLEEDLIAHRTNNAGSLERTRSKSWRNAIAAMEAIRDALKDSACADYQWSSFVNWSARFSYWSMSTLDDDALTTEVVDAFTQFLSSLQVGSNLFYDEVDEAFFRLADSNRLEIIKSYIEQRSKHEALVRRLYGEEHELMATIDNLLKEVDKIRQETDGLRRERDALVAARPSTRLRRLLARLVKPFR